ncbi:MAG TPA: hypothetical protein VMT52_13985 [Planctomycetota bacterium]|nr:hypothetical protein [Planctomycetota bacterium]
MPPLQGLNQGAQATGWDAVLDGWDRFRDGPLIIQIVVSLVLAVALASTIAYHPRRKSATLEEAEQPKIFLMYALVGALVAQIVEVRPAMAFVIFGIGGLLRFRTDVGAARDTGRIILVTCVGLCCGLQIYVVGVLATLFGWILIYFLDGQVAHRVVIKGLEPPVLVQAATAYYDVLIENGLNVMSQKKNILKKQVAFVFRAPGRLDREEMEALFKDIPPKFQGAVDWESS